MTTTSLGSTRKTPRRAPARDELARALEHADMLAPPDDDRIVYVPRLYELQAESAYALGTLAAEVRSRDPAPSPSPRLPDSRELMGAQSQGERDERARILQYLRIKADVLYDKRARRLSKQLIEIASELAALKHLQPRSTEGP